MKIRDAVAADLPAIVEIYNSTIPGRMVSADTEPLSVEQRLPWFEEHEPARRPIWVMEHEEEVVGWLSLSDFFDRRPAYHATAEIGVYVREGDRGKGIGRRLVEEAIRRGPELGLKTLTAGAFVHNDTSVRLFEKLGFREWAYFPNVAELDDVERDLVVLGLRLEDREE
jgi:phosphinothricin acetyltransferase